MTERLITRTLTGITLIAAVFIFAEPGFAVSWAKIGPDGGSARRFVQDPRAQGTLYAETGWTRLAKTVNGGALWRMIYDAATPHSLQSLSLDQGNSSILFAVIQDDGLGAAKSTDGGLHWTALPSQPDFGPNGGGLKFMKADPFRSDILYAANEEAVCKSTDGGATWRKIRTIWQGGYSASSYEYTFLVPDPAHQNTVYLGGIELDDRGSSTLGGWLEKSVDGGASWEVLPLAFFPQDLTFDPLDSGVLYGVEYGGIHISPDGGRNWARITTNWPSATTRSLTFAGPAGSRLLYAGTSQGLFRSADAGLTWTSVGGGLPLREITALHADLNDPSVVWASANEAGIFKSTDGGFAWFRSSTGFRGEMTINALAVDPSRPATLYVATQNDLFKSPDRGSTWDWIGAGLQPQMSIKALAVPPNDPDTIYIGTANGIYKSTDAGRTWTIRWARDHSPDSGHKVLVIDPLHPDTIYAGSRYGLFKSTDGGSSWTDIGSPLGVWDVLSLVLDPANPSIVYASMYTTGGLAGANDHIYKSTNGGIDWTPLQIDSKNGWNEVFVALDPSDPRTLYASSQYGVYKTEDAGATWKMVLASTFEVEFGPIAVNPKTPSAVYVLRNGLSKSEYVFRSLDGGEHWTNISEPRGDDIWLTKICPDPSDSNSVYIASNWQSSVYTPQAGVSVLAANHTQLSFGAVAGGSATPSQSVRITNAGEGTLNWTALAGQSWIGASPAAGAGNGAVKISVNPQTLAPGVYTGWVRVDDPATVNKALTIGVVLTVYGQGGSGGPGLSAPPFGVMSTPWNSDDVSGSIPVTGWALDDVQVANVRIFRDPVAGEADGLKFIGEAVFVDGARPDVEAAYPGYPLNSRAGWGYMLLTNMLPNGGNGTYVLHALATDAEGHAIEIGAKTIVGNNALAIRPFGAIDTPAQGGTVFGSDYVNFGWALTPLPNMIPLDGSTLTVWVDGLPVGHPVYNNYREDIAGLFPALANTGGAVGYFHFDTTALADGVHTIAWSARDNAGNEDGIGSRYFTIQNGGSSALRAEKTEAAAARLGKPGRPIDSQEKRVIGADEERADREGLDLMGVGPGSRAPVWMRRGFRTDSSPEPVYPDNDGRIRLQMPEAGRIEIDLNGAMAEGPNWTGALIVNGRRRPLPIGSRLDPVRGIFYWQPGPGFLGSYEFVFSKANGPAAHILIAVGK